MPTYDKNTSVLKQEKIEYFIDYGTHNISVPFLFPDVQKRASILLLKMKGAFIKIDISVTSVYTVLVSNNTVEEVVFCI